MATRGRPRFTTLKERNIDGVLFRRTYNFVRKDQAQTYADKLRAKGTQSRVLGHAGAWTVYKRVAS